MPVVCVSGDVWGAQQVFGNKVKILDKVEVITGKSLHNTAWIDDDTLVLRAVARKGAVPVHVDDALEFLAELQPWRRRVP